MQAHRDRNIFTIPHIRHPHDHLIKILNQENQKLQKYKNNMIGYQANMHFNYQKSVTQFLNILPNNIGDPFTTGTYTIHTRPIQTAVLDYYAQLWNVKPRNPQLDQKRQPQDPDAYWGYCLSMGSSQGNLMTFWMARDYIEGKYLIVNTLNPDQSKQNIRPVRCRLSKKCKYFHKGQLKQTVYFSSAATHYSVVKSAVIMNVSSFSQIGDTYYKDEQILSEDGKKVIKKKGDKFPQFVPAITDLDGRIDPDQLVALVRFFAKKRHGIIVILNYGTTFTGAHDQVQKITHRLQPIFKQYGLDQVLRDIQVPSDSSQQTICDARRGYWIHVDGALGGGYGPYLTKYYKNSKQQIDNVEGKSYYKQDIPQIDFENDKLICSTTFSGHKFPGAPWPCGVYMSRHKYQLYPPSAPMYIGSMDSTLSGSRNGVSPIVLWHYLSIHQESQIQKLTHQCLVQAQRVQKQIRSIMQHKMKERQEHRKKNKKLPQLNLIIHRAPFSLSLVFSQVIDALRDQFTLAEQDIKSTVTNQMESFNHIYIMEHVIVNPKVINQFLQKLKAPGSFKLQNQVNEQQSQSTQNSEAETTHHHHKWKKDKQHKQNKQHKHHKLHFGHGGW